MGEVCCTQKIVAWDWITVTNDICLNSCVWNVGDGVFRRFIAKDISSVVEIYLFLDLLVFQSIAVMNVWKGFMLALFPVTIISYTNASPRGNLSSIIWGILTKWNRHSFANHDKYSHFLMDVAPCPLRYIHIGITLLRDVGRNESPEVAERSVAAPPSSLSFLI